MSRQFTVIGFWNSEGQRHVVGVVEGEHQVTSGIDVEDNGLFAVFVYDAIDADSACSEVHGTTEEDDLIIEGLISDGLIEEVEEPNE